MLSKHTLLALCGALVLTSCGKNEGVAPRISVTSPASGAPVSGTVSVQFSAADDARLSKISLYVRSPGTTDRGTLVGSATSAPFVISFYTPKFPNGSLLELVPIAQDAAGNVNQGDPIEVKVQNAGSPALSYLAGFNLPPDTRTGVMATGVGTSGIGGPLLPILYPEQVRPPQTTKGPRETLNPSGPGTLAVTDRTFAIEWGWPTVPGADGYGIYLSTTDASGPYVNQRYQAAGTGGNQKFSRTLVSAEQDQPLYGAVTTRTQGNTVESGLSNADEARFMTAEQQVASPIEAQVVADGRPILTWNSNSQAGGYLYYVLDKTPFDPSAKIVWTNAPQSTDKLSAAYPANLPALKAGTYFWWVGGVSFDSRGQADAFSFSAPRTFVVP